jgi:hypothetical protein
MIKFLIYFIFIHNHIFSFSQEKIIGISKIETIDSLLIGKKIKQAIKIPEIDTLYITL